MYRPPKTLANLLIKGEDVRRGLRVAVISCGGGAGSAEVAKGVEGKEIGFLIHNLADHVIQGGEFVTGAAAVQPKLVPTPILTKSWHLLVLLMV